MIVYVESNFVLELAYLQEEHESCERILALSIAQEIELALPAFCLGEPYESWVRRSKQRRDLKARFDHELAELSRSKPYAESLKDFREITKILSRSEDEEKQRLDSVIGAIVESATIVPVERDTIKAAIRLQSERSLVPQDAIVYASVLSHMSSIPSEPKCFLTKNSKDFANPDIDSDLSVYSGPRNLDSARRLKT